MAEGMLRHLAGDGFEVFSAGIEPTEVHPMAIKVMEEIGIDFSGQYSKAITEFSGVRFDYVITVCDRARQAYPLFPGEYENIHWNLEDPAAAGGPEEEEIAAFRKTRNQIRKYLTNFL